MTRWPRGRGLLAQRKLLQKPGPAQLPRQLYCAVPRQLPSAQQRPSNAPPAPPQWLLLPAEPTHFKAGHPFLEEASTSFPSFQDSLADAGMPCADRLASFVLLTVIVCFSRAESDKASIWRADVAVSM